MPARRVSGTMSTMLDPDLFVLCEHDREPDECPICGALEHEHSHPGFDPIVWVERYRATLHETADFPDELVGVPLN